MNVATTLPAALVLNPVGTEHSVWTKTGCTVLIQWVSAGDVRRERAQVSELRFDIGSPARG